MVFKQYEQIQKIFQIVNWRLFLVIVSSDWPWYIFLPRCVSNITHLSLLKIDLGHNLPLLSVAFKRPRVEIASPFFFTNSFLQQPKSRHLGDISNLREERSSRALLSSKVSFKGHLDFCWFDIAALLKLEKLSFEFNVSKMYKGVTVRRPDSGVHKSF